MGLVSFPSGRGVVSSEAPHLRRPPRASDVAAPNPRPALAAAARWAVEPLEARTLFAVYNVVDLGTWKPEAGWAGEALAINASDQVAFNIAGSSGDGPHAARYSGGTTNDLGTFGGPDSQATGINASGQVVGLAQDGNGNNRAFLWDGTSKTNLGTLGGGPESFAFAVNDGGLVVGSSLVPGAGQDPPRERAVAWQGGTVTDLGTLGPDNLNYSRAYAVSNAGQIAGETGTPLGDTHAFRRTGTTMTDLGVLSGGDTSSGRGINEAGQVVGYSNIASGATRAFLHDGSSMQGLGTLAGDGASAAFDINNSGQIVGYSADNVDLADQRAVLFGGGTVTDLNTQIDAGTGWTLIEARALNDNGDIVGIGRLNGQLRAFLLTTGTPPPPGGGGDTVAPTAAVAPAAPAVGTPTSTVTVTYTDDVAVNAASIDAADLQVVGPGGPVQVAAVSLNPAANAASIVATYTLNAPGGTWDSADDGAYTVTLLASQVRDAAGNPAATAAGQFSVAFGAVSGPAVAIAPVAAVTTSGATSGSVTVTYADNDNVSVASLGADDVTISGVGIGLVPVTGFTATPAADAASVQVTYTFAPPGGSWDFTDNAQYTAAVNGGQVLDALGNAATGGSTTFDVDIPVNVPTLDLSFNAGAVVGAGFVAEATVADLDGRLYVAGRSGDRAGGTSAGVLKRYNPDGSVDATFGTNGVVTTPAGQNDAYYNVALDPGGKFVVVSGARGGDFLVARYATKSGKLDGKYGSRGAAVTDLGGDNEVAYGLGVAPDGAAVAGGGTLNGLALLRFDRKGKVDAAFGPGGSLVIPAGEGVVAEVAIQPDGFIVAAGDVDDAVFVVRVAPDGALDPTFNGGSARTLDALTVRTDLGPVDPTIGLALQPDGKILVANRTPGGEFGVVRLDAAGGLDATFGGGDGVATADLGGTDDDADDVVVQGTGQVLVVGTSNAGGTVQTAVAAFDAAGALEGDFDDDGLFVVPTGVSDPATALVVNGQPVYASAAITPAGKLVTTTSSASPTSGGGVRRLTAPGSGLLGQFGTVNGRRASLTFTDADGTRTTLSLKGGTGTAFYDGTAVDLVLTGTTAGSSLSVKGKGGDGRTRFGDVRADGALGTFAAKTGDVGGTMTVNGDLRKLDVGTVNGVLAVAANIRSATFRGDLAGARVLAGADLGPDLALGGANDTYAAATIGKFSVAGTVAASVVGAGFDPVDADFFNGGVVTGGAASFIKSVSVKRATDGASRFFAGAFGKIKAPEKVDPAADPRFEVL